MKRFLATLFCGITALFLLSCDKVQDEKEKEDIAVTSVSIGQATAEMLIGETVQLSATVLPSNATDKTVSWASSKQSVATVSSTGLVTALAEGTTTITASAGGKSGTCTVTVNKKVVEVSSVTLNKTELPLYVGESESLSVTVKPDDATYKTVSWSSSDPSIAKVENGTVTAVKKGTATITATAGDKSASCSVVVSERVIPVSSVELNKTSLDLVEGDIETLTATVKPNDATDKTISWSTSNPSVAKVDNGTVTAVKEGTATITATAGEKSASCNVTVSAKKVDVAMVMLNTIELELIAGDQFTLVATVVPENATDQTVQWSTSDASVAKVESGVVTGLKKGMAKIVAYADGKTAECAVTVLNCVSSITLSHTEITTTVNSTFDLVCTINPDDAVLHSPLEWIISDQSIVIMEEGKFKTIAEGEVTVTAKADNQTASCKVICKKASGGNEDMGEENWK